MFMKKKSLSPLEETIYTIQKKLNQWDKQRKHWKARFYVTVVFPVVLVLIAVKAIKTYVRIKLWEIGTKAPSPFKSSPSMNEEKKTSEITTAEDESV